MVRRLRLGLVPSLVASAALAGCTPDFPGAHTTAALTVPVPPVTSYVILASRSVSIGQRNNVAGGDLGVAPGVPTPGTLTAGIDSRVGVGEVLLAQTVTLFDRVVAGEIGANTINLSAGVVTGPRSGYLAPPAGPTIPVFTAGTAAVNVAPGQTLTLPQGDYGAVNVSATGTLNLSGGTYEIQSLVLGPDARVAALTGSTIRVQTGVSAGDRADIVPAGSQNAGALRLIVNGTLGMNNSVNLGTDVVLTAIVVARNTFRAADRFTGTGAISAQDVIFGNDSRMTFAVGFGCGTNASCNDNNPCTTDTCVDSMCVHGNSPNGTACTDGNSCTQTDTCQMGVCTGGNPVVCMASDQCHVAGVCNPASGMCSNPNRPNGSACNDTNACTQTDTCQMGVCTGGNPVMCTASDQCHVAGVCNPANGMCSNPNAPNGTPCSDMNACTQTDTCQAGMCAGGNPVVCMASDQCHAAGMCNPMTGTCTNPNAPNGTPCSDMNACTQADACNAGMCVGGNPVVCMATDQCHVAGMCNPMTGTCTNPNAPDGTPCNDGSDCSQGDACQGGVCTGTGSSVTEYASVVPQPKEITPGPDGNLWFVSTEAAPGVGAVARIAPASGAVTSYLTSAPPRPSAALVDDIVAGPNGNLWFTERFPDLGDLPGIAEITPAGVFVVPDLLGNPGGTITSGSDGFIWTGGSYIGAIDIVFRNTELGSIIAVMNTPRSIAPGPDGNIWFVASNGGALPALVGRVVPSDILGGEVLTEFPVMTPGNLNDIVGGPDGNLWFTDEGSNQIGRITPAGVITKFSVPTAASGLHGIVLGPDGNLWFTERVANKIGRITTAGVVTELACIPTANSGPTNIALGADGKLWFTQTAVNKIATIAP